MSAHKFLAKMILTTAPVALPSKLFRVHSTFYSSLHFVTLHPISCEEASNGGARKRNKLLWMRAQNERPMGTKTRNWKRRDPNVAWFQDLFITLIETKWFISCEVSASRVLRPDLTSIPINVNCRLTSAEGETKQLKDFYVLATSKSGEIKAIVHRCSWPSHGFRHHLRLFAAKKVIVGFPLKAIVVSTSNRLYINNPSDELILIRALLRVNGASRRSIRLHYDLFAQTRAIEKLDKKFILEVFFLMG